MPVIFPFWLVLVLVIYDYMPMIWFFISIITYIVGCPMIVKPPMNPTYLAWHIAGQVLPVVAQMMHSSAGACPWFMGTPLLPGSLAGQEAQQLGGTCQKSTGDS